MTTVEHFCGGNLLDYGQQTTLLRCAVYGTIPGQRPLQRGGDGLPGDEVVRQLQVGGQGEPLVDLLLLTTVETTN